MAGYAPRHADARQASRLTAVLCALGLLLWPQNAVALLASDVRALFDRDLNEVDFGRVKVAVDRMVDPSIDAETQLAQIDHMVATIEAMLPPNATSWERVDTIRRYIYEPGPWNEGHAFSYDHDDPYGLDVRNKLLSDYLQDRRGNCVTMPILFVILGQRLGLDVAPAMAPLHVFVKFTDDQGMTHNLETTSGAGRARDQHYRDLLPITDAAIENGVFLTALDDRQSIALISALVVEALIAQGKHRDAMAVADILIDQYPSFAYIMIKKATASYHLLRSEFYETYPTAAQVPQDQRPHLTELQSINQTMFRDAETLGWRPIQR